MSRALVTFRNALRALAFLGSIVAVSMVWGASAQAALEHPDTGRSFGPDGTGAGTFVRVIGVAVDQKSGDVFVYDQGEGGSIFKFDAAGEPVDFSSTGTNAITGVHGTSPSETEIAVDGSNGPDAGDIYVATKRAVRIFSAAGALLGELTGPEPCGVAVDSSGAVYVGNFPETVTKYIPVTNPVSNSDEQSSMRGLNGICNVAVDGEGNVYAATYTGGVTRYDSLQFGSLTATGTLIDPAGRTLTVDPSTNHVYVDEVSDVAEYDSEGKLVSKSGESILAGSSFGVAVKGGTGGEMYASPGSRVDIFGPAVLLAHATTEAASNVADTSVTLAGSVNPEGTATTYQFEYGTNTSYGSDSPVSPESVGSDSTNHALEANLSGLAPSTLYHYRISATNENGVFHGADQTFRTTGPPTIDAQSATVLGQKEATIEGQVNPSGFDTHYYVEYGPSNSYGSSTASVDIGSETADQSTSVELTGLHFGTTYHYRIVASNSQGAPVSGPDETFTTVALAIIEEESISEVGSSSLTLSARVDDFGVPSTYRYEYGQTSSYGSTTPKENLAPVNGPVGTPARLSGLQPGMAYHFRIVVENEEGAVQGEDSTFSTLQAGIIGLPDRRGYEMVTPVNNEGIELYAPFGSGPVRTTEIGTPLPTRGAADGSAIAYVGEPTAEGNGSQGEGAGNEFIAVRTPSGWVQRDIQPSGFSNAVFASFSDNLSVGVLSSTESMTTGVPDRYEVLYTRDTADGSLHPLFTTTPPNRKPTGEEPGGLFGAVDENGVPTLRGLGVFYAGESQDSSRKFFEANDALTSNAVDGGEGENNLYESVEGQLRLVNVLPDGSTEPNASFGTPPTAQLEAENATHAISTDGSRVFWTDLNTGSLYVRESQSTTVLVAEHATFLTASVDGSKVLYQKGGDLYEDDLSSGVTTDLVPGAELLGIAGTSEDASYVYFVGKGVLVPGARAGRPNIYLHHAGVTTFISALSAELTPEGVEDYGYYLTGATSNDWRPSLGTRTAQVNSDGHDLVFTAKTQPTGYDNRLKNGEYAHEVYLYDADTKGITCLSCDPSGQPPSGTSAGGYLPISGRVASYQLRLISEDGGRVFFQTSEPLVVQDVNGQPDVYEWERNGEGSCELSAGCTYLLSGGSSPSGSYILDASANGSDVFIETRAKLLEKDQNELYDVYDARVGAEEPPVPPQCTGTGCQGTPAPPPIFATPSSATFNGVGNFAAPVKATAKPKAKSKAKAKSKKGKRKKSKSSVKKKRKGHSKKSKKAAVKRKVAAGARRAGGR